MADPFSVKMKLVADIARKGENATPIVSKREDVRPRVDIKTEVETGQQRFEGNTGTTTSRDAQKIATSTGGAVNVGQGGGVLGHRLQTMQSGLADPDALGHEKLAALLAPHVGRPVVVTTYDRDEASDLAEAAKKHGVGDTRGTLVGVNAEGIQLKKDGRIETVRTEFWHLARIRLDDDAGTVLAQDPAYPKHFVD